MAALACTSAAGAGLEKHPQITTPPQSVLALEGRKAVLFARAYGAGKLTFQWMRDGIPLAKADEPVLNLDPISVVEAGAYQVVVSSPYGKATSDVARVTVVAKNEGGFIPAVFSCNAVGFINLTLLPGLSLVAHQFAWNGEGGPTVSNILGTLPNGFAIYQVASNGFTANAKLFRWTEPQAPLGLGESFFALNPFDFQITLTMVGEVPQGDLQQILPAGYSIAASFIPQSGGVSSILEMPQSTGDEVWRWNSQTQSYVPHGFLDAWQPQEPVISVGEAFVVKKLSPIVWRRLFEIELAGSCPRPLPGPLPRVPMPSIDGQLHFFTFNPDPALGRVEGAGSDYFGQLYAGLSTNENDLAPCGVPERFFDSSRAGYIDGGLVTAPGLPAGRVVQTQLRMWRAVDGATYEAALATGCFTAKSDIVPAMTGAPVVEGQPGIPPRPVNHFRTFRPPHVHSIVSEPPDLLFPIGKPATLTVTGTGGGPLGFLWSHNGVVIPDTHGPQLQFTNVVRTNEGDYSVIVTNGDCAPSIATARLTVYEPIRFLEQPADIDLLPGGTARFAVVVTGEPPLTYQWRTTALAPHVTNALLGANSPTLVLSNVVADAEGEYWVEIRSPFEETISPHARLSVRPHLRIEVESAKTFRLVWPRGASAFVLEQSAELTSPTSWNAVPQPVKLTQTECFVSVPRQSRMNQWFRLRLP